MPDGSDTSDSITNDRLDGWGEIAAYLRRDIRTVQRWEKQEGLPVHRHPGARPRVWAVGSELDQWWNERADRLAAPAGTPKSPSPEPAPVRRRAILAIAIICGALLLVLVVSRGRVHQTRPEFTIPDRVLARGYEPGAWHRIPVKGSPGELLLPADGKDLYVLDNFGATELQVIDPDHLRVSRAIPVPGRAGSMALSPDDRTLYIGTLNDGLYVVDRQTGNTRIIRDNINGQVRSIACAPDGRWVYLALEKSGLREYDIRTGAVVPITGLVCPERVAVDPQGRYLFVSSQCGGTGGSTAHDTIDILERATKKPVNVLGGPPRVAGSVFLFPRGDRIWVTGGDACSNPAYRPIVGGDCPFFPGTIHHVFRLTDRRLLRTLASPADRLMESPTFTPDGERIIVGGDPLRVMDSDLFDEQETLQIGSLLSSPRIDLRRQRIYFAGLLTQDIRVLDLPQHDCHPPLSGLLHHWTGDGNSNDRRFRWPLTWRGEGQFEQGIVGAAFRVSTAGLEISKPYARLDTVARADGTLQAWIRLSSPVAGTIVSFNQNDATLLHMGITPDLHLLLADPATKRVGRSTLRTGQWYHIAIVRAGPRAAAYLDGSLEIEISAPVQPTGLRQKSIRFGPLPGLLDELAIYGRPLQNTELQTLISTAKTCLTVN